MRREQIVAEALADALLSVEPQIAVLIERAAWMLGRKQRWIASFCTRRFHRFGSGLTSADRRNLVEWIRSDEGYRRAWSAVRKPRIAHYPLGIPRMAPRPGALAACALPSLHTSRDLADWLGITTDELDWFADLRRMHLAGRLAYMATLNPARGARLHRIFHSIAWDA